MQVKKTVSSGSEATFTVTATPSELDSMKSHVLTHFQGSVKVPGFRAGKVPSALLAKHVDQNVLQSQFLQEAIEQMYAAAINELAIRPVANPKITVQKFVAFATLEFEASVTVMGSIKLADYTSIKKTLPKITITDDEVQTVIKSLQQRMAEKYDVSRAAHEGDQIWIDFKGTDAKGQPVKGADGKNYPLLLGSNTFIPGFEANLTGLKPGQNKEFTLKFPNNYGLKALASKKVTFHASVIKVQEMKLPKVDDEFAAKAGPFKTVKELKNSVRNEISHERQHQLQRAFESELVQEISKKSSLQVPDLLIDNQVETMMAELQQNLVYRSQTLSEFLKSEAKTEEQYKKTILRPQAEERVRASLVLSEIAEKEKITVTDEEIDQRIIVMRGQYQDPGMQAELDKPEARRDIGARILTEKTLMRLVNLATR